MEPSDSPLLEPIEYEERYERTLHIEDALKQHNEVVGLLAGAERDRATASDPQYDGIIRKLQALERESGERVYRDSHRGTNGV
jgi:NAD-dependent DNA ligase